MLKFPKELEAALHVLNNMNNKEQNMQGRLYAHFLQYILTFK